jgi:hypothetical protein
MTITRSAPRIMRNNKCNFYIRQSWVLTTIKHVEIFGGYCWKYEHYIWPSCTYVTLIYSHILNSAEGVKSDFSECVRYELQQVCKDIYFDTSSKIDLYTIYRMTILMLPSERRPSPSFFGKGGRCYTTRFTFHFILLLTDW